MSSSSSSSCRLTIHSPNNNANKLYATTQRELYADQSFLSKYWPFLIFFGMGFIIGIIGLIAGAGGNGFFLKVLLIFGALGALFQCIARSDASQHSTNRGTGSNKARTLIEDKLDVRIQDTILKKQQYQTVFVSLQQHQSLCTTSTPTTTTTTSTSTTTPGSQQQQVSLGHILPYSDMNRAGCLPPSSVATYELAWTVLKDRYEQITTASLPAPPVPAPAPVAGGAGAGGSSNVVVGAGGTGGTGGTSSSAAAAVQIILDLHELWITILTKSATIANTVTNALDNQRIKATQQVGRNATGNVLGVFDTASTIGGIYELGKELYGLKGQVEDLKEIYDNIPKKIQSMSTTPRTGLHSIVVLILLLQIGMGTIFIVPIIIMFAKQDSPGGAWGFFFVLIFIYGMSWYMQRGKNDSLNGLEDLIDLEQYVRQTLQDASEKYLHQYQQQQQPNDDLIKASNELRNLLLEGYYDTLGIHCQTNLFSFGHHPGNRDKATPLFWNSSSSGGGTTAVPGSSSNTGGMVSSSSNGSSAPPETGSSSTVPPTNNNNCATNTLNNHHGTGLAALSNTTTQQQQQQQQQPTSVLDLNRQECGEPTITTTTAATTSSTSSTGIPTSNNQLVDIEYGVAPDDDDDDDDHDEGVEVIGTTMASI